MPEININMGFMKGCIVLVLVALAFLMPLALSAPASRPSFEVADNPVPSHYEINFSINFTTSIITAGDIIGVNASIFDISGIDYAKAEISEYVGGTMVAIIPLYDDGAHNDGGADDDIYGNFWDTTGVPGGLYVISIWTNDTLGYGKLTNGSVSNYYPFIA